MRTFSRTLERTANRTHLRSDVGGDQDADNILYEDGSNILLETPGFLLLEKMAPTLNLNFLGATSLDSGIAFTRASTATYFNSAGVLTTAGSGVPRFDYNPSTLQPRGLLIEEQRTNSFLQSESFGDVYWVKANGAVTDNAVVAPDGTLTADYFYGSGSGAHYLYRGVTLTQNQPYTMSCFVKQGNLAAPEVRLRDFTEAGSVTFNIVTGTISVAATGICSNASIVSVGNGWFRISAVFTPTIATGNHNLSPVHLSSGNVTTGFYCWGAQLEVGAFVTSYIPTTTTALTRNADVASMTGTNFSSWYNASEGTIVAEYVYSTTGISNQCAYSLDNGTSSETIIMASTTPAIDRPLSSAGGVGQLTGGLGNYTFTAQQLIKRAVAYKLNDYGTSVNGGAAATDTSYTVPSPDRLTIGAAGYFSGSRLNGTIRRIAYYSVRLTNAQLQALTA